MSTTTFSKRNWFCWSWAGASAVLASCLVSGCVIVPVPVNHHTAASRTNVQTDDILWLVPGQTTREEVLLRLGEPDAVTEDDLSMSYRWEKIRLGLFAAVFAGYGGGSGYSEYARDYTLDLHFDPCGKFERGEVKKSKLTLKRTL
ncbi:MAG: hypothetical protein L0Y58_24795 [Verrucomicrobia subdivision 3 bacterium]|nr:hypothetical protein [Limisphaerales bacterium]